MHPTPRGLQKVAQNHKTVPKKSQEGLKTGPDAHFSSKHVCCKNIEKHLRKIDIFGSHSWLKIAQSPAKMAQDKSRVLSRPPQDRLKTTLDRPKTATRSPQETPRRSQEVPRPPQEAQRRSQEAPRPLQEAPIGPDTAPNAKPRDLRPV